MNSVPVIGGPFDGETTDVSPDDGSGNRCILEINSERFLYDWSQERLAWLFRFKIADSWVSGAKDE